MSATRSRQRFEYADANPARSYQSSVGRWSSVGPYYAMFPVNFAFEVIRQYSLPGNAVLDPFAGRGSSIYAAAAQGRQALGIEINPVGWLYGNVKLNVAASGAVLSRLADIACAAKRAPSSWLNALPEFFRHCYAPDVNKFLLEARRSLKWRRDRTDATLMALILVYLHGKRMQSLSNQMRDSKAMSPAYAVRWWVERRMPPPEIDVVSFMRRRIAWRYAKGIPDLTRSASVLLGDSTQLLTTVWKEVRQARRAPFDVLFTSPPYFAVTNYHYDQWLRLWMLGGASRPEAQRGQWAKRFENQQDYVRLITGVFASCAEVMRSDSVVYVRTDAREFTRAVTLEALRAAFPGRRVRRIARPVERQTQTALFGDKAKKPGEIDLVIGRRAFVGR